MGEIFIQGWRPASQYIDEAPELGIAFDYGFVSIADDLVWRKTEGDPELRELLNLKDPGAVDIRPLGLEEGYLGVRGDDLYALPKNKRVHPGEDILSTMRELPLDQLVRTAEQYAQDGDVAIAPRWHVQSNVGHAIPAGPYDAAFLDIAIDFSSPPTSVVEGELPGDVLYPVATIARVDVVEVHKIPITEGLLLGPRRIPTD